MIFSIFYAQTLKLIPNFISLTFMNQKKFQLFELNHPKTFSMKSYANNNIQQSIARQIPNREQCQEKKLRRVLKQCYFVLNDLKERNRILQDQLNEKNVIIHKITEQKQNHIMHMSICNSQILKKQLQESLRRSEQIKKGYEKTLEYYEEIIKKSRQQNEKLRGFNKVLRIQNSHLRQKVSKQEKTWRQRQKKIGKITPFKTPSKSNLSQNIFFRTKNPSESQFDESNHLTKGDLITPQKFKTSKSTNLSSTLQRTNLTYSQDLSQRKEFEARNLFHNPALQKLSPSKQSQTNPEDTNKLHSQDLVNIWFQRLKNLLADSDEEQ